MFLPVAARAAMSALLALMSPSESPQESPAATRPPLTWECLAQRLDQEAAEWFSGVALVVRDGQIVLHQGYGLADRKNKLPNRPDTIFAIGSTPIDFTHVGILLLAERGKLSLSDPITKYFQKVPADKQAITVEHLMTGRSGLRDFHDVPEDADPDHTWIDRDEAVRRILAQQLLFEPGRGDEHSHSAWGLLAAIIEVVSGQTYPEFTREHLFKPAGMVDTGFFGEPYPPERMAIGYGPKRDGRINAPPYWGKTSWLVMGSGGQVSTALDTLRWMQALRAGKILKPESLEKYFQPGRVLAGGDMYGFEITYTEGPASLMILISNGGHKPALERLVRDLVGLVSGRQPARFALGVEFAVEPEQGVRIRRVLPGGAAERGGLQAGDVVVSANGRPMLPDPRVVLDDVLREDRPIVFGIERAGQRQTVSVKPLPRSE